MQPNQTQNRSKPETKSERPMSAAERAQRILAPRWAGVYSRAGAPSRTK